MALFQNKYRIESARLSGWNYGGNGWYFVTICTKDAICYFGKIVDGDMVLSASGRKVVNYWLGIPNNFLFVTLDAFVVMPNHVHGILVIDHGARSCRDAIYRVSGGGITHHNNPMGQNTLGEIIRWFKGRCTFEIRKKQSKHFKWQPRFHDRIIRDKIALSNIRNYIHQNPTKWNEDHFCIYK